MIADCTQSVIRQISYNSSLVPWLSVVIILTPMKGMIVSFHSKPTWQMLIFILEGNFKKGNKYRGLVMFISFAYAEMTKIWIRENCGIARLEPPQEGLSECHWLHCEQIFRFPRPIRTCW
jgi:hypothetical protein